VRKLHAARVYLVRALTVAVFVSLCIAFTRPAVSTADAIAADVPAFVGTQASARVPCLRAYDGDARATDRSTATSTTR